MKPSHAKRRTRSKDGLCYLQQFAVPYTYPVHFTHGVLDARNRVLESVLRSAGPGRHKVLVYVDEGLAKADPAVVPAAVDYLRGCSDIVEMMRYPESVPGGERTKNGWNVVQNIMSVLGSAHLCRHSFVVAIGGGSMLDMVGFAVSLVHRGVRLIRVPTTVLSQCDAAVGVKNGMDEHGMKNFVGTFAPPYAVLVDFRFLKTLPPRYWTGGVSEAFKVAIIKDAAFFRDLCAMAPRLRRHDARAIEDVVTRAAILHLEHIRSHGDPFEFGTARPLDFGHWAAHRLEMVSNYALNHGEAVAIGIALDTCYAALAGRLTTGERDRILNAMRVTGLPLWSSLLEQRSNGGYAVLRGLDDFREHLGGVLTVTLPDGIGRKVEVHEMDRDRILAAVRALKQWTGRRAAGKHR